MHQNPSLVGTSLPVVNLLVTPSRQTDRCCDYCSNWEPPRIFHSSSRSFKHSFHMQFVILSFPFIPSIWAFIDHSTFLQSITLSGHMSIGLYSFANSSFPRSLHLLKKIYIRCFHSSTIHPSIHSLSFCIQSSTHQSTYQFMDPFTHPFICPHDHSLYPCSINISRSIFFSSILHPFIRRNSCFLEFRTSTRRLCRC